jgi:hydrogenase expression/formation protein HypD
MDKARVNDILTQLARRCDEFGRRIQLMEICGTHTVSLLRSGVKSLVSEHLQLISGPGCPVCVTSQGYMDAACELADRPELTICTYGDMVRVPGSTGSLEQAKAAGADIRVVYSPRDALALAIAEPAHQVVFLAIGFETTAPATAAVLVEAKQKDVTNFFVLSAHKRVLPAVAALMSGGDVAIDGLLCPGHVSIILGADAYQPVVDRWRMPCVIAGFEPMNMLAGIAALVEQVVTDSPAVENVYGVAVSPEGNTVAQELLDRVFIPGPATWRAMGEIPESGMDLREEYRGFDAALHFGVEIGPDVEPAGCKCGQVIQGKASPVQCGLFGNACTPLSPVGPCMVSSEGTCAAWYKYNRRDVEVTP